MILIQLNMKRLRIGDIELSRLFLRKPIPTTLSKIYDRSPFLIKPWKLDKLWLFLPMAGVALYRKN